MTITDTVKQKKPKHKLLEKYTIKERKSRHIYGNRFSDISLHPMDQYKWEI